MGAETKEGKGILKRTNGRKIEVCSPIKGTCDTCMVGKSEFCLTCNDKNVTFEEEFVVLPGSDDKPILGIQAMRDMDLVGEYAHLFRTAENLAKASPPIASAGDEVTTHKKKGSAKRKIVAEGNNSPSKKGTSRKNPVTTEEQPDREQPSNPSLSNVAGSQGKLGIPDAMKSRRILKVGKRRVDGRSTPITTGTHGKRFGGGKRKLRELNQLIATLKEHVLGDDGDGNVPTSSESGPESGVVEDGTIFHRDDIFTVVEADTEAAEAEEAWMEKRELVFHEADTDPVAQMKIEGPPTLQSEVRRLCTELRPMFRAQIRPEPAQFRDRLTLNVDDQAWLTSGNATQRLRAANAEKQEELRRQTQELLDRDCIEPCQEPVFSQPVLAKKPNGKWRFCIDYRVLNACSESLGWPIPKIKEVLNRLGAKRAKYYGVIDLTAGYHQAELDPKSRKYTTFKTHMGTYQWKRVPFGLKGAPSYYQQQIADALEGLLYMRCEVYIDDIIIYGTTEEEFLDNLRVVLERLNERGITVNPAKCKFGLQEVEYVGHVVSREGLTMSEEKKAKVLDFPIPDTIKQLRGFLGLVNYFRDHVRGYAATCAPMHALTTQAGKRIRWTEEAERAFEKIKIDVSNLQTLFFIDDDAPVFLHTDACKYGLGGYLFQMVGEVERPISFYSRSLKGAELNWSTIEQECFGIVCAVREFDHLLRGRPFTIRTDHANLVLMNISQAKKVIRWKMELMEYDFEIEHIAGVDNIVADAISRCVDDMEQPPEKRRRVDTVKLSRMRLLQDDNAEAPSRPSQVLARLHIPPEVLGLSNEVFNKIKHFHNELVGHGGVKRTLQLLHDNGKQWKNMQKDVKNFVAQCPCCQKNRMTPFSGKVSKYTLSTTSGPMKRLSIDTVGPFPEDDEGNMYVLVAIDNFSRYTTLWPTKDQTGMSAAKALLRHVGVYGTPDEIQSDGGPQFYSEMVTSLYNITGIDKLKSAPYSHEENGIAERAIKSTQEHLRALLYDREIKESWSTVLPLVQRIMNASRHQAIDCSPAQIIFGNSIDLDRHIVHEPVVMEDIELPTWHRNLVVIQAQLIKKVQELLKAVEEKHCQDNPTGKISAEFPNGSFVVIKYLSGSNNRPPTKLHTPMKGPFRVVGMENDHVQIQDVLDLEGRVREVHVSACRPFNFDPTRITPRDVARRDNNEFFIEKIVSHEDETPHRSKTKPRKDCLFFTVRWLGYGPEADTREPWSGLKDTTQLWTYLHRKGLEKLIPKDKRRADGIYDILQ